MITTEILQDYLFYIVLAVLILAIELTVIGFVRRRQDARTRDALGREPSRPAATSA